MKFNWYHAVIDVMSFCILFKHEILSCDCRGQIQGSHDSLSISLNIDMYVNTNLLYTLTKSILLQWFDHNFMKLYKWQIIASNNFQLIEPQRESVKFIVSYIKKRKLVLI